MYECTGEAEVAGGWIERARGRKREEGRAQQVLIRKHNARNIPEARIGTHSEHMAPYLPREDPRPAYSS